MPKKKTKEEAPQTTDEKTEKKRNIVRIARMAARLPKIDISDPAQLIERIEYYIDCCESYGVTPNIVGMASWLGVATATVRGWRDGQFRSGEHRQIIESYMGMMENILVDGMIENQVTPVNGIYLSKVLFGYKEPSHESQVSAQKQLTDADAQRLIAEASRLTDDSDESGEEHSEEENV